MEKKQGNVQRIIIILVVLAAAVSAAALLSVKLHGKKAVQTSNETTTLSSDISEAEAEVSVTEPEEAQEESHDILAELGIEIPEKDLDWDTIRGTNPDIYAWIYVPGTNIDYPVLQNAEDDSYYLNHNLDGSEGYPGCIYTESINSKDFTDHNTVIYGHNMRDGSMFATLHNFEDPEFFENHRYCYIYMPDGTVYVYDIFGAYEWSNEHILKKGYVTDEDYEFESYLEDVFAVSDENRHFREGVHVITQNHIITMVTCIGGKPDNRYLVQGVLINDPQLTYEQQMELYNASPEQK